LLEPRLLKLKDVATILSVREAQVYALVRSGELPAIKIGALASYFVLQKPLLSEFRGLELTAYAVWAGTLVMLPGSLRIPHQLVTAPVEATLSMVYLGVFPGALAYVTWAYALGRRPAAQIAQYLYAAPVVSAVLGFVLIGERLPLLAIVGGALTLAGVVVGQRQKRTIASPCEPSLI
jgi:drug/metabolite transporter (DMT)-like permease